jgi:uncharacterized SAM-binding protein YcdF (DUF218 family)
MLIVLSKIFVLPFYPVGLAIVLLIAALIALYRGKVRLGRVLVLCAVIQLYIFSTDPLSYFLVRSLEKQYNPSLSFPDASAIVLLTGGEVAKAPPRLYDEVNSAGDRILYSARLMKQHTAPRLIITGGNIDFLRSIKGSQAEASYRLLTELLGVDSSLILLEKRAPTTYENGVYSKAILDSLKLPPVVILVTSAMHMPRSVAIFRKLGCTVYPAPTDYLSDVRYPVKPVGLLPCVEALLNSTGALHEYYGIIAYKLLGRL